MPSIKSLSAAPALLAALSLTAMPVQAAELPAPAAPAAAHAAPAWMPGDDDAAGHRRYRHRRDRGVDAGDVLAGILIIGGIAAIANAAKGSTERYPRRDTRYPEPRRGGVSYDDGRGIDRAVDMCVDEIERNARVDTVDAVNRDARGWTVSGALYDGQGFNCSIGADGRIEAIDYDRGDARYDRSYDDAARFEGEDRQYDDAYYAAMRARSDSAQPAYPGGPLPGDEDAVDADLEYGTGYQGARR
ncbi:hypothetical protein N6L26_06235 [Qipengyuania sp. SS22]|uniref:hypothetical protein n=1 Tax=Qipengyuania sp. SS22 TaxID=2979461 RepID=UPI0021E57E7F|nr:hypothetical protein [Qipengyuania sp. SS22]UYH56149.1 hypothetical protein N6L26_06235 [Qipengyuania sp. SS22]